MEVNEKIWTKDFIIMSVINFLVTTIFFLLMVTIGQFAMDTYKVSPVLLDLSLVFSLSAVLSGVYLAGRFMYLGSIKLTRLGLIGLLITTAFYFVTSGFSFIYCEPFITRAHMWDCKYSYRYNGRGKFYQRNDAVKG